MVSERSTQTVETYLFLKKTKKTRYISRDPFTVKTKAPRLKVSTWALGDKYVFQV